MKDTQTIVADTLRTMMGATASDPYVRAIERAIARQTAEDNMAKDISKIEKVDQLDVMFAQLRKQAAAALADGRTVTAEYWVASKDSAGGEADLSGQVQFTLAIPPKA